MPRCSGLLYSCDFMMKTNQALVFVSALICVFSLDSVRSQTQDEIRNTITTAFQCQTNNPGLTVAVVKDGQTIFAEGFGKKSKDTNDPVISTTLFGIGALTKGFTNTLLNIIIEQQPDNKTNKITLDSKLKEASINETEGKFFRTSSLRSKYGLIRDVMAHRLGYPKNKYIRFDDNLNRTALHSRLKYLRYKGRFRDSYYYNDVLYGLLVAIIEKHAGGKYEPKMKEKLLSKLGMTSTDFWTTLNTTTTTDIAKGYIDYYGTLFPVDYEFLKKWSYLCGSDCMVSNAVDMAEWMKFLQARGAKGNEQILAKDVVEDMYLPWMRVKSPMLNFAKPTYPYVYTFHSYGLGFRPGHYRGYRVYGHSGYLYGYTSHLTIFQDYNISIFTAMTGEDEKFKFQAGLHAYLADSYLNEEPWLNTTLLCNRLNDFEPDSNSPAPTFDKTLDIHVTRTEAYYVGNYTDELYGNLTIDINNAGKLIMKYGFAEFNLYPKPEIDRFYFESRGIANKVLNMGEMYFKEKNGILRAAVTSFESRKVPRFKKVQQ